MGNMDRFTVTGYDIKANVNLKICVLSDLHGKKYGYKNEKLIAEIKNTKPDIICIPGDLVTALENEKYEKLFGDDIQKAVEDELDFLEKILKIAPVYYSPGNHEERLKKSLGKRCDIFSYYLDKMKQIGIFYLDNESKIFISGNSRIKITGLSIDLLYYKKLKKIKMPAGYAGSLAGDNEQCDYEILLAHNPDYFENYKETKANLVLSGHMHGGLIRLPFIGALVAPNLTLFPKYDAGMFCEDGRIMIVSKGLGTHTFNIRINNMAELLCIHLNNNNV